MLQECNLSLLCVPRQKMCFVPVLGSPDRVLEVRWQHSRSFSAAITDTGKNRFPSSAGVARSELKASPVQYLQELLATDHFGSNCGSEIQLVRRLICHSPSLHLPCPPLFTVVSPLSAVEWSFIRSRAACGRSNGNCSQK